MKTSELTGPRLDYWVAKAEGIDCALECSMTRTPKPIACWRLKDDKPDFDAGPFCPSSAWHEGGPIIERERILCSWMSDYDEDANEFSQCWWAWSLNARGNDPLSYLDEVTFFANGKGPAMLVAAMRAYVASKFGEEVPDVG